MTLTDKIEKLARLKEQGLLSQDEFDDAKSALISTLDSGVEKADKVTTSDPPSSPTPDPIVTPAEEPILASSQDLSPTPTPIDKAFDAPTPAVGVIVTTGGVAILAVIGVIAIPILVVIINNEATPPTCTFNAIPTECTVTTRIGQRGYDVYDISAVGWVNRSIELFDNGNAWIYTSNGRADATYTESDGFVQVDQEYGTDFTFRF